MINLIPNQEKKRMNRDFYFRLATLVLFMMSSGVFIATLSILPAYFLSNSKIKIAEEKLEKQKAEAITLSDQETGEVIKDINNKLMLIGGAQEKNFLVSQKVINTIVSKKNSNIKITKISYDNNTANVKKILVEGTSPSRDALLLFRKNLEIDPAFKSVELPISNFVKGTNIQFFISIVPA